LSRPELKARDMPNKRLHWDGTVSAGNVLTLVGMLVVLLVWGVRQEARIDQNEYRIGQVEEQVEQSLEQFTAALNAVETRIGRQIDGLSSQVERIENILLRPERASP